MESVSTRGGLIVSYGVNEYVGKVSAGIAQWLDRRTRD